MTRQLLHMYIHDEEGIPSPCFNRLLVRKGPVRFREKLVNPWNGEMTRARLDTIKNRKACWWRRSACQQRLALQCREE